MSTRRWRPRYRGQTGTFDGTQARPIIVASKTNEVDLGAQPARRDRLWLFAGSDPDVQSRPDLPYSITHPDKNQWAPRFGFAWRPMGETTVIRGGYGIFYEGEYTDSRVNLFMPPFLLQETALNDRGVSPTRTFANFFLGAPLGSRNTTVDLTPDVHADSTWATTSTGISACSSKLRSNMVVDVEYVGNKGIEHSEQQCVQYPGTRSRERSRRAGHIPRFGPFGYISSDVSTTYHALQAKLETAALCPACGSLLRILSQESVDNEHTGRRRPLSVRARAFRVPRAAFLLVQLRLRVAVRQRQTISLECQASSRTRCLADGRCRAS